MAHILKRREVLLAAAEKLQRELFAKRISWLMEKYRKEENRRAVTEAFAKLASYWNDVREDQAASLGICYLYSSILMRTYELKIFLLGEEFWLDEDCIEASWVPPYFYEHFEEDMNFLIKELKGIFPRLCRAEEDAVRIACDDYYLAAVCKLCRDMAEEILADEEFNKMNKTDHFYFFFGRFQGEGEILWRRKESED